MATIWCNGEWLEAGSPLLLESDRGGLHGLGLFETLLAVDGQALMVARHAERLKRGAKQLGWTLPKHDWQGAVEELLRRNALVQGRARIRLALSGGSGSLRDLSPGEDRLLWMSATALGETPQGLRVAVCPWRRNEHSALAGLKCASYAENLVALNWARREGLDEVLFLNAAGQLCEAATANVFLVGKGGLRTPDRGSGCLPGILRELIVELAPQLDLVVEESPLRIEDAAAASEIFLTNAVHGVMSVSRLGETPLAEGPVTRRLQERWQEFLTAR